MNTKDPRPYWNPYLAGALLGVVLFLSFFLTGSGLGGSGGIMRLVAWTLDTVAPHQVETNAYWAGIAGGPSNVLNHRLVWGALGVLAGGLASGLLGRRVRLETLKGPSISVGLRLVAAFAGGGMVGYAARLARGCTSGQALSGGAVLSAGSWAFMFSVFGGGYLLAWFVRRLWR